MAIGIVTAFFDIGREDWAKRPNTPAWLARSTEDYFACFERMCRLENEIVVFTQSRFAERIAAARGKLGFSNETRIVCKDTLFEEHGSDLKKITRVMNLPGFLYGRDASSLSRILGTALRADQLSEELLCLRSDRPWFCQKRISCLGRFRLLREMCCRIR